MKANLIRFISYASMMSSIMFFPIFAKNLGIPDAEIGLIVAFFSLALFLSSFIFGRISDKYGRKLILILGLALSSLTFFLQIFAQDMISLLLVRILVGFALGMFPSSLIAYIHENKRNMSKFSAFGALGWALGVLLAGAIALFFSIESVFIFGSLLFIPAILAAVKLKIKNVQSIDVPFFPIKIIKKNRNIYLTLLIRHSGAHMIWTFWPLYLQTLGANLFWIGAIETLNNIAGFLFMYLFISKIKSSSSFKAGLVLSVICFFFLPLAGNFWQLIPPFTLLGVSWALLYVGGLTYLMEKNPEKATVSGLFESAISLSAIIGPFLGSIAISLGGYEITMYFAAIFSLISLVLFIYSK